MLFRDPSKPELIIEVPPSHQTPKAVVLLMGWYGSKLRHVRKYSEIYDQRGCATITGCLDDRSVTLLDVVKIDEFSSLMAQEAAKLLRTGDKVPLICHAFSNGGGIPLQRLQQLMAEKLNNGTGDDNNLDDWNLIRDRMQLGAEIFDSAPAFPDMETFKGAITTGIPGIVGILLYYVVAVLYYQTTVRLQQLQGIEPWVEAYWKHWETCPIYSPIQAYIYSTADTITKYSQLDELTKTRAERGVRVKVMRFEDSQHVQHMIKHKEKYCGLIDEVLTESSSEAEIH